MAGKNRDDRVARERARLYQARGEFHESLARRRTRDNVVAGVVGGTVIALLLVAQTLFYTVGPGTPAPAPTDSPSPTITSPVVTPTPAVTPGVTPTPTP